MVEQLPNPARSPRSRGASGIGDSQTNVEIVKSLHPPSGTNLSSLFGPDAEGSGRFQRLASRLTADFEAVGGDLKGGRGLTMGGHGLDGLLAAWRDWLRPWETYWTQVEEFADAGGDRVLVLVRDHGRLRGSDSEVENIAASIWTLREGKIARIEFHSDRTEALKAVGLAG
jgi:hypothetical protein